MTFKYDLILLCFILMTKILFLDHRGTSSFIFRKISFSFFDCLKSLVFYQVFGQNTWNNFEQIRHIFKSSFQILCIELHNTPSCIYHILNTSMAILWQETSKLFTILSYFYMLTVYYSILYLLVILNNRMECLN